MTKIIKYDAACRALAEAKTMDEIGEIREAADAMRAYARIIKNRDLEIDAAEIRLRAERRLGQLINAQKESVGLAKGGFPYQRKRRESTGSHSNPVGRPPTLEETGINKYMADRARKLAGIAEEQFEAALAKWRERMAHRAQRVATTLFKEETKNRGLIAGHTTQPAQLPKPFHVGFVLPPGTRPEDISVIEALIGRLAQRLYLSFGVETYCRSYEGGDAQRMVFAA